MKSPYTFKHIEPTVENINQNGALFLLHGLGSDEEDLLQLVHSFNGKVHIFSLRGPITHRPGFAFYTFEEEGKPLRDVFDKMIVYTKNFVEEAIEEYNLDASKVYIIGFNQGAVVAQALSLILGNVIGGTIALSGYIPDFVKNEYNKAGVQNSNIFISHGEYDYDYPLMWAENSRKFFEENGANVIYKTYPVGHGVSPENIEDFVSFINIETYKN